MEEIWRKYTMQSRNSFIHKQKRFCEYLHKIPRDWRTFSKNVEIPGL